MVMGQADRLSGASDLRRGAGSVTCAALFVFAGLLASLFYSQFHLSHDNSWYLIATRRFMDGATLYVDIIELNPPLAFYLTVPGLALADGTGLPDKAGYVTYVSMLATIANIWAASIVSRSTLVHRDKRLWWIAAPIMTLILPISEFGQREHLLIAFTLPYFFAAILHEKVVLTKAEQIALGLFAVLGFALKPYFYLAPLFLALGRCWREKKLIPAFSPANLSIGLMTLAYLGFIWVQHPEYVSDIVPLANAVYHSYGMEHWRRWLQPAWLALPFIVAVKRYRPNIVGAEAAAIILIALGFVASYFVQFKGWNYHVLPAAAYLLLAITWLSWQALELLRAKLLLAILLIFAVIGTLGQQLIRGPYKPWTLDAFSQFVPRDGMGILLFSSNVSAAFPFVNEMNGKWASRYPAQWLIPGSLSALRLTDCNVAPERCQELQDILMRARADLVSDLIRYQPELVYVDEREEKSHFDGQQFDYVAFLDEDARFAAAWQNYERVGKTFEYRVFRLKSEVGPVLRRDTQLDD